MGISGNRSYIYIRQSSANRVSAYINEGDLIKLKTSTGEVVVEIKVTGYVTDVDLY